MSQYGYNCHRLQLLTSDQVYMETYQHSRMVILTYSCDLWSVTLTDMDGFVQLL